MERYAPLVCDLYNECGTLDPFAVADSRNIEYRYVPFLRNPEGQFLKMKNQPLILLADWLKESNRRYFIITHELYHALAHDGLGGYYISTDHSQGKMETEANLFALCYLSILYRIDEEMKPESYYDLHYKYGMDLNVAEEFI